MDQPLTHSRRKAERIEEGLRVGMPAIGLAREDLCPSGRLLVWVWNEHNVYSRHVRRAPQNRLAILVDEIEAHLHPKWQRAVLPALLDVTTILAESIRPQLIVATHSPLIMASIEQHFDASLDRLFHLGLNAEQEVELKQIPFIKRGRVNSWLTSDLNYARLRCGRATGSLC